DQCVRQVFSPLSIVATETGCAILLVRHLVKKTISRALLRGQGSMGIIAAVRTGLIVAQHPDDPDESTPAAFQPAEAGTPTVVHPASSLRVLAAMKSNVGRQPPTLGFRVIESASGQPVIGWTGPVDLTADNLCEKKEETRVKACDRA